MTRFKICFLLALGLAFGMNAWAVDFKMSGQWIMNFGYGANGRFMGSYQGHAPTGWVSGRDNFEPSQRLNLQLDANASERLAATVSFEMGQTWWGANAIGGSLGADKAIVKLNSAYLDWRLPDLLMMRAGLQSFATPALASGNAVLNDTMAAIVANWQINADISLTAFWARAYNDNYPGVERPGGPPMLAGFMDNVDALGALLPINCDGVQLVPWLMYAGVGPNALRGAVDSGGYPFGNIANLGGSISAYVSGMLPAGGARYGDFGDANQAAKLANYGSAWWAGCSGRIAYFDPFVLAFDVEYGAGNWQDNQRLHRAGWFATLLLEYKLDWGSPGIYGWYGTGDDGNPANGSERMPALDPSNTHTYSHFAFDGAPYLERSGVVGDNMAGTWGIGFRILKMSFMDKLSHSLRLNFFGGTNSPEMAKKMSLADLWANGVMLAPASLGRGADLGMPALYLTSWDNALEVSCANWYKIYENLLFGLEAAYIGLWLNTGCSAWGARATRGKAIPAVKDAWNFNLSMVYSF